MGYRKFATQGVLGGKKVIKYGNFTAFGGLKLHPAIMAYAGIAGLVDLKRTRPDLTVSWSPFGPAETGTGFVKGAPVARGKTIADLEKMDVGKAIVGGLRKAVEISKRHTEKGVALVNIRGKLMLMPAKAAEMLKEGRHKELVRAVTILS
jgi:hypothetical protein